MTILNIGIMAASDCSNTVLSSLLTYMAFISIHGPNHNLAISRGVEHTLAEEFSCSHSNPENSTAIMRWDPRLCNRAGNSVTGIEVCWPSNAMAGSWIADIDNGTTKDVYFNSCCQLP